MKRNTVLLLAVFLGILTGCSPSREKRINQINGMEKRLFAPDSYSFNKEKADSLVAMYLDFIADNPKDTLSAGYLFKAANIVMNSVMEIKRLGILISISVIFPMGKKFRCVCFSKASFMKIC